MSESFLKLKRVQVHSNAVKLVKEAIRFDQWLCRVYSIRSTKVFCGVLNQQNENLPKVRHFHV